MLLWFAMFIDHAAFARFMCCRVVFICCAFFTCVLPIFVLFDCFYQCFDWVCLFCLIFIVCFVSLLVVQCSFVLLLVWFVQVVFAVVMLSWSSLLLFV